MLAPTSVNLSRWTLYDAGFRMTTAFKEVLPQTREQIERVRSRVDKIVLKAQGRLDHPNVDRFTPWVVSVALFAVLFSLALARSRSVDMGADLAAWLQSTWLLGEGFKPEATLTEGNILAEQVAIILYPLALITRFAPTFRTEILLLIQSAGLALTIIPLWRLARGPGRLRVGVTSAVAFAFCVYAAVHNINLAGFHPSALALPALVGGVLFGLEGHRYRYMACVGLALSCRADLGLAVAALGVLLILEGKRRWGGWTALTGLTWTVLAIFVVQPRLAGDLWPHVGAFANFGDTPFQVIGGIITNPIDFLRNVFSEANFRTVVTLFAPVLFLPLVAPRYLMPVVPLYSLYLAADVTPGPLTESPQTVPMTAFIFVATVFALKRSGQVLVERVNVNRRVVVALLLTASVFFVRDAVSSPYEKPWNWSERQSDDLALIQAASIIPEDALVRASPRALPLLAERLGIFELTITELTPDAPGPDYKELVNEVDWIVFDPQSVPQWDSTPLAPLIFQGRLGQEGFVRVDLGETVEVDGELLVDDGGIMLFAYVTETETIEPSG